VVEKRAEQILAYLDDARGQMVDLLSELVAAESPSDVPDAQVHCLSILFETLQQLDYDVEIIRGRETGGHLFAKPKNETTGARRQLLLGHCDTVWPLGTLKKMPFTVEAGKIRGPGVYDMKGGLVQMLFALKALKVLGFQPRAVPSIFINSDEEIGSFESSIYIKALAKESERVFVLEPSLGRQGKLKTARKGVGRFEVTVNGVAAHAGLDPEKGRSAILELAHVIQQLFAMNDPERGISVNVGVIEGGLRPNVIAPVSKAVIDVRVPTQDDAEQIEKAICNLAPVTPGVEIIADGRVNRAPLERTPANKVLWRLAKSAAAELGLALEQGMAGGGSDGNITSQFTATLDGLGAVGDGAHANHEFIYLEKMTERSALLSLLLLAEGD